SVRLGDAALPHILARTPATLVLAVAALIVVVALGVPFGVAAGRRPGGALDRVISTAALVTQSLPTFWVGIMLILLLAGHFRVFPSGGAGTPAHLVLPAITLGLPFVALVARLVRSGVIEESRQGYVRTAQAKGLSQRVVFYGHVLRNVLVPVVTVLGLVLGQFVGSAVVIETVFAWPGLGKLLVESILYRDYAVVQAAVALIAVVYVVLNLIVDLTYGYLDPRIRLDS
ncbi:MAG: ABC transporter permease, partial [Micromonosporaceae bacterium]